MCENHAQSAPSNIKQNNFGSDKELVKNCEPINNSEKCAATLITYRKIIESKCVFNMLRKVCRTQQGARKFCIHEHNQMKRNKRNFTEDNENKRRQKNAYFFWRYCFQLI